jgi:hypothetical protein
MTNKTKIKVVVLCAAASMGLALQGCFTIAANALLTAGLDALLSNLVTQVFPLNVAVTN